MSDETETLKLWNETLRAQNKALEKAHAFAVTKAQEAEKRAEKAEARVEELEKRNKHLVVNVNLGSIDRPTPEQIKHLKRATEAARDEPIRPMPVETTYGVDWKDIARDLRQKIEKIERVIDTANRGAMGKMAAMESIRAILQGKNVYMAQPSTEASENTGADLRALQEAKRQRDQLAYWITSARTNPAAPSQFVELAQRVVNSDDYDEPFWF